MRISNGWNELLAPLREEVFNRATALAQMDGDADLLAEMATLLLRDYPKQLSAIHAARTEHDTKVLERAAHKLRGSVAIFGAKQTYEAALRLETMAREGDLTCVEDVLRDLDEAFKRLTPELERLVSCTPA